MKTSQSKQLENWLSVLISCYQVQPSINVIKHIIYYLERIMHSDDYQTLQDTPCQYQSMKRFWQWKLMQMNNESD